MEKLNISRLLYSHNENSEPTGVATREEFERLKPYLKRCNFPQEVIGELLKDRKWVDATLSRLDS